jgi:signal transduction histidine kinase
MPLHEVLAPRQDEIIARWERLVLEELAPGAQPSLELVDHMPGFLEGIIVVLREAERLPPRAPCPTSHMAAIHGEHRLRLGFSLDAVIHEYSLLRTAIIDSALEAGAKPEIHELQVLFDVVVSGMADAVSEYSRRRDAEFNHQASEHLAFIAHELGNPLGSARVAFALLQKQGFLPAGEHAVAALGRGLEQASELIHGTLQNARIASGSTVQRERTSLRALVADATVTVLPEAETKGVDLRESVAGDADLDLDRRLVRSALGNLVRNGVKYTPPGSTVEVRARVANGRAVFEVEDCCGGIPEGKIERVFMPFVRFDEHEGGFGLGLAIAKQAVHAHGGSLRVQNLPGKGCIFVMELPATSGSSRARR